jgi:hypothetical protein
MIRIGKNSISLALLNTIVFITFINQQFYTGINVPNIVATGTLKTQLDRDKLIQDPQVLL